MKTLKSLFMLCAGLSFCACGSDDDPVNQLPEGNGMVEVKIVAPQTRAETSPDQTGGTTVEVTGDVFVTVVHNGADEWTQKVAAASGEQTVKFYGVTNPTLVKVSMNGGKSSYSFTELTASTPTTVSYTLKDAYGQSTGTETASLNLQEVKAIPVYGEAVPTLSSTMEQPTDQPDGETKQYQMYTAIVNLRIPVARLEVSIEREDASELFKTLNVAGAYLDNLYSSIGVTYLNKTYPNITPSGDATNYYFDQSYTIDGHTSKGTTVSPLKKSFDPVAPFTDAEASTDVVGFNIFGTPAANVPHFKFVFTDAEANEGKDAVPTVMYAKITSYKETDSDDPIALNNGEIYQIIDLAIDDDNIGVMEDKGDNLEFGLTATVVKANWTIKKVTGTWEDN